MNNEKGKNEKKIEENKFEIFESFHFLASHGKPFEDFQGLPYVFLVRNVSFPQKINNQVWEVTFFRGKVIIFFGRETKTHIVLMKIDEHVFFPRSAYIYMYIYMYIHIYIYIYIYNFTFFTFFTSLHFFKFFTFFFFYIFCDEQSVEV